MPRFRSWTSTSFEPPVAAVFDEITAHRLPTESRPKARAQKDRFRSFWPATMSRLIEVACLPPPPSRRLAVSLMPELERPRALP
jgi:hypothetical protein